MFLTFPQAVSLLRYYSHLHHIYLFFFLSVK
jgi:hypothetical protein